jgi:hydroxymethylpyrimidine pyrophosphatase-like HAD family hydrolase
MSGTKLGLLALDYDGTIAEQGRLDAEVRRALVEARARATTLVLVTGRILADLQRLMRGLDLFDAVVAENGALLHFPRTGRSTLLACPPDPAFAAELGRRQVPFLAGECVVELDAHHAPLALAALRELELPLALLFNRGRLMVLPQAVSKATGLREAARALRVSLHNAVGIGDAENDHDLLRACEVGVAVAWGSPALQRVADVVLPGRGPAAVAPYVHEVVARASLPQVPAAPRRRLHAGLRPGGDPVTLDLRQRNLLVAGAPQSGKSWVTGLLCEQLILQHYCVCVIDPEGDYSALEALPGVIVLYADDEGPWLEQVELTLRYPDVCVIVDLCRMSPERKRPFVGELLECMAALRRRTGLPHRVVVDEAHYFLRQRRLPGSIDLERGGYLLVTYRVSQLDPQVLGSAEAVIVTGEDDPSEAEALRSLCGQRWDPAEWAGTLRGLEIDEAALLPGSEESGEELVRFRIGRRLTPHVRHRHKYLEVPVPEDAAFRFHRDGEATGQSARSLQEWLEVLERAPDHTFDHHLERGDFSRWVAHVFADAELAEELRRIEEDWRAGRAIRPHDRMVRAVRRRYRELPCDSAVAGPEPPARSA